ncbi:DUF4442 domain-containing protein [Chryseolinea soli]|uniref:DUF4442 domain-containing protein n=1 Tax=Chryseolinea soli TaxID=2321403 RepID=A0A385SGI2_9BACT|nr:DUF4442 domain-containing protein [Chryseolinea soli]AYB29526.1 DUF4442 domain-containing protein [Chryseolinea soli]
MNISKYLERAKRSSFHLWVLNQGLLRMIPFNKPHAFTVTHLEDYRVRISIPYKRKNFNHIRGLHACALATLSEYATGFLLISRLGFDTYRVIMQRLEMEYHYQGKMDAVADFALTPEWIAQNITAPLNGQEAVVVTCEVKIHDLEGKHLTTGRIHWQIKKWASVKTKVVA